MSDYLIVAIPDWVYARAMGLAYATLTLRNPRIQDLLLITVNSLADTGALHLCLPSHVALQLKLEELEKREVITADGRKMFCPYVSPAKRTVIVNPDSPNIPLSVAK